MSLGKIGSSFAAAQLAQELGLPSLAIPLYQELLNAPGVDRAVISLPLASALLDAGRAAEAEQVLEASPGPRTYEWRLRLGLAYTQLNRVDDARDELREIDLDSLTKPDRAWFYFLRGAIQDLGTPRDVAAANDSYRDAEKEATSDFARARFATAAHRLRLNFLKVSANEVALLRQRYEAEQQRGRAAYLMAEDYAVLRDVTGGKNEAVRFLSEVLLRVPRAERQWHDRLRLLLGLIGEKTRGGAGRNALVQLLEQGSVPDLQRQALQVLAQHSTREPERGLYRGELDRLLGAPAKSAIHDGVLLMRAQLALTARDYAMAERRANELKDSYPGSALRPHALVVLATSAWEQHRYRVSAEHARLARETLAAHPNASSAQEGPVIAESIAELRVFEAEARFRAQDYRLAAEAYAAAVQNPPAGIKPGDLMFQRALASIRAEAGDPRADLASIVDQLRADPRFDVTNRWEAEWSLARGLKIQGRTAEALQRVSRLLENGATADISPELRARMSWLQARLSFEAGRPELTLELVPRLEPVIAGLAPGPRTEILSTAALLKAEAEFRLDRETAARETLAQLREVYPATDAAIYSYLVTAAYFSGRDQIQDAQRALRTLIDEPNYQASPYVPYALFQLALLSERLGQRRDLEEANDRIEELVRRTPPAPPELVFAARLKQGDLLRTLNDFPRAQVAYEDLVNNPKYAQRPDVVVAQLRLAECHHAQSSMDLSGSHADIAQSMFEELLYRVSAPAEVRVEAGYNLGKMLERRGQREKARSVWFSDVIMPFLLDVKAGDPLRSTQPYWLARTLLDLGTLLEQEETMDEARRVYALLRDSKLGFGEQTAIERLQRLGIPAVATVNREATTPAN